MSIELKKDLLLCDKCQKYGYCIAEIERSKLEYRLQSLKNQKLRKNTPLTVRQISQWVPLRTTIKEASTNFGKKLQKAHELFHQDEFEQASYIYQDILQTRYDCDEAQIGLVSAFYFLKKYEEAVVIADRYHERWLSAKSNQFVLQCLIKLSEQKAAAIDYQKSVEKTQNALRNIFLPDCQTANKVV